MYSQMPLQRGPIYREFTRNTANAAAEYESNLKLTTDTPCLALTGELWAVSCEAIGQVWPRYNGIALYIGPNQWSHTLMWYMAGWEAENAVCSWYLPQSEDGNNVNALWTKYSLVDIL